MNPSAPIIARRRPILPMILIGAGLVLLGIVSIILLTKPGESAESTTEKQEPSAIPVTVNFPAPDLRLSDLNSNPVSLADFRGKTVLLNNWATWCPPCKAEMPILQAYFNDHRHQGFVVVAVESGQPIEEVADFVKDYGLTFIVWPDPHEQIYKNFHNISLPASWVIDPQGQVRLTWTGAVSREVLESYLTPLLEQ